VNRGEKKVYNFDVREAPAELGVSDVSFTKVDITSSDALNKALLKIKPDVVHHTASPLTSLLDKTIYEKVNVRGTANVIQACQRSDVKKLVFTSSAGVVFDGHDNINIDERMPYPEKAMDAYNDTKAQAERLVLGANTDAGTEGLKTVALRPAGIFGPHDRQAVPGFIDVLKSGRNNVQLGDNSNLFDWTYVDNIAHAHLLAADKLSAKGKPYPRQLLASTQLPQRITGLNEKESFLERGVPTSENRPDVTGATDYARSLPSTVANASVTSDGVSTLDVRPVIRNKYDQFFHIVNPDVKCAGNPIPDVVSIADEESLDVGGQAFFITNGLPLPFWDFPRALWKEYDPLHGVVDKKKVWKIPRGLAMPLATVAEYWHWITGTRGDFETFKVTFTTAHRYHNIEKARRLLGYEPVVGMEEAIKRSVASYKEQEGKSG
jgi:sterol-4alpha-carboxylate 3-dehydrogenase (decarboxylating)